MTEYAAKLRVVQTGSTQRLNLEASMKEIWPCQLPNEARKDMHP